MGTIKLTVDQLKDIAFGESEEYVVIEQNITGTFRHGNENEAIIKRVSDGKYFRVHYRDSVKETCEFDDMNYGGSTATEVTPTEKTITVYI